MNTEVRRAITGTVRDDGGVVLDGTVNSLGAVAVAYEAAAKPESVRYVIVDLDIQGKKYHQEQAQDSDSPSTSASEQTSPKFQPHTKVQEHQS